MAHSVAGRIPTGSAVANYVPVRAPSTPSSPSQRSQYSQYLPRGSQKLHERSSGKESAAGPRTGVTEGGAPVKRTEPAGSGGNITDGEKDRGGSKREGTVSSTRRVGKVHGRGRAFRRERGKQHGGEEYRGGRMELDREGTSAWEGACGTSTDGEKHRRGAKRSVLGQNQDDGDGTGPARPSDGERITDRINSGAATGRARAAGLVRLSLWRGGVPMG